MQSNIIVTAVVVIYLLVMLLIGYLSSKKIESNTDFVVAGRRLGPFLMAGTLAATEIGGGSSRGVVQQGMESHGLSAAWYIITMGFAFVILTFLAPKFRAAMVKTVPEYFRRRYGKPSGIITSLIMFVPLIGLTAGQFIASSVILSTMLNLNYKTAVLIVGVVVTIYAIMGGLWSVTLTDFVQVFLIVIGMIIALPFGMNLAGGWDNVVANVPAETFDMFKGYNVMDVISLTIMYVATFTVGQEAVSRYYAARDGKAARQGSVLAAIVNFIYAFVPTLMGIIVLALINMGKFNAADFQDVGARYALPVLAMEAMPAIICGLLFAGIVSATMSSADSDLLGAGSIFANDIYKIVIKPSASDKEIMIVTRVTMAAVGVFATLIALYFKYCYNPDVCLHPSCRRFFLPICSRTLLERSFPGRNHGFSDRRNYCCSISGACFQRKSVRSALQSADRTWTGCCVDRIPYLLTGYASKEADNRACT